MLERVVDGGDAAVVLRVVADAVALADGVRALHAELGLERADELAEEVDDVTAHVFVEGAHDVRIHEGREDDRTKAFFLFHLIDALRGFKRLLDRVDERDARLVVVEVGELRHDRMRERFGGDGGAVAHDEDLSAGGALLGVCHGG